MQQESNPLSSTPAAGDKWYTGVTRYQWMVLAIASAGWVFDVFEGQLFGSCMHQALPVLLAGTGMEDQTELFINLGLGAFLAGGAVGGLAFGMLADRWGRTRTMVLTILMYSVFTGLTALAQTWWQLMALRFLVGMGVGGEWSVAAAIVAEVFPQRARPAASGIFHASSVLGTYLAVATGLLVGMWHVADPINGWRWGFLVGIAPALLILWIRVSMKEPEKWTDAKKQAADQKVQSFGRFSDLFAKGMLRNTLVGTSLAIIGLATFWGGHFRGRDIVRDAAILELTSAKSATEFDPVEVQKEAQKEVNRKVNNYAMLGWFLVTTGGGLGLLSFAPISQWLGRRPAFVLFHVGGFVLTGVVFLVADSLWGLLLLLPAFGFFTLAMHAGYAVYFPELYPTRLRSTGVGFCFNVARVVVVPVLLLFAWLQNDQDGLGLNLAQAVLLLSSLFLVGAVLSLLGPETRGQALPE
jgi:MFS family permease